RNQKIKCMMKKILFILFTLYAGLSYGQNTEVSGRVLDDANDPLPGVSVSIKGTSAGTATDSNGAFSIRATKGQVIVFSLIGMETKEVVYNNETTLNVTLAQDQRALEEVVVIGYQTIKKADLTGAVSVFNPSEMKNTSVTGSVGDALGTLPGVNVRTAGAPGREGKVEIRGTGTFGSSNPLYVVDGVVSGADRDFNFKA